jgi:Uma2 family endonuclease
MPQPKPRRATYDDIIRLPEHLVGEIIDGELIVTPRPATPHALTASVAGGDLLGQFHRPPGGGGPGVGGWWILYEPELHLRRDVIVPDIAGWRREKLPVLPDTVGIKEPPDWVCEVVSPSTGRIDRTRKRRIYAREKIAHLWMIEPLEQTLEVYRLEARGWMLVDTFGGDDKARAEPFDAVEIDLSRWWLERAPAKAPASKKRPRTRRTSR